LFGIKTLDVELGVSPLLASRSGRCNINPTQNYPTSPKHLNLIDKLHD